RTSLPRVRPCSNRARSRQRRSPTRQESIPTSNDSVPGHLRPSCLRVESSPSRPSAGPSSSSSSRSWRPSRRIGSTARAGQRHPGRLPPGLRAPATRTDRLPAARPRLPHGPVLGEPEPTDSHRFPGTGDGRARGVSALTPRRRILGARANTGQTEGAFMAYHADSSDLDEKEILTWDLFGQSARELAQTIADSDYDPE